MLLKRFNKSIEEFTAGSRQVFDRFECAVHEVAPICEDCEWKIVGRGIEANGKFFCCANCARAAGTRELKDRI